jgi:conjugal transfer pilus assembly protein TraW
MMKHWIAIGLLTLSFGSFAKEIGTFGKTYPILEEDFLEFIKNRVDTMQKNGEWKKVENQLKERAQARADRPTPLGKLTKAGVKKQWTIDPSMTLSQDLKDHQGRIFAKSGTTFNPLTVVSLKNSLLFIDADDEKQVTWAKLKNREFENHIKLILVKGSVSQTEKIFHQRIYFDQQGQLTQHFHIEHVPAMVSQEVLNLKVTEDVV